MKRIVLVNVVCFCLVSLSALNQSRFPIQPSSVWRVDSLDAASRIYEKTRFFVNGDTLINGTLYFKIYKSGVAYYDIPFFYENVYVGAVRDNDNRIYYIKKSRVAELFLFDFNLRTGDTIKSSVAKGKIVLSIDTLPNGRKIYNYDIGHYTRAFLIEGIGTNGGLFSGGTTYVPMHSGESACYLICYTENKDLVYQSNLLFDTYCDIVNSNHQYKINPSSKWRYNIDIDSDTLVDYERYQYNISGDTIINAVSYYKFFKKGNKLVKEKDGAYMTVFNEINYIGAIRDEDNKYYFIFNGLPNEELLYDFNLNKGDTNNAKIYKGEKVFDTDTVLDNRKVIYFGTDRWNKVVYAGIGATIDPLSDNKINAYLRCYSENEVPVYYIPGVTDCDLNMNDASFPVCNNVNILPNYLLSKDDKKLKIELCYQIPTDAGILPVLSSHKIVKDGSSFKVDVFYNDENPEDPGQTMNTIILTDTIQFCKLDQGYYNIYLSVNIVHSADDNDTTFNYMTFNHEFFIYNIPGNIRGNYYDEKFKIYPVPARNNIIIEFPNVINRIKTIEIINLIGEKVLVKNCANPLGRFNQSIDVSGLKQGVYLLSIVGDNLTVTQKIVIY